MASSLRKKNKNRNKTRRKTSNIFSIFSQDQIQEFKEAFNFIDQNHDGFVDKEDLLDMMTSLGKNPTEEELERMVSEAPGPINFTMFLTLFGEKFNGTDPEEAVRDAFRALDDTGIGAVPVPVFRDLMSNLGDRWSEDMLDELLVHAPVRNNFLDIEGFVGLIRRGKTGQEDDSRRGSTVDGAGAEAGVGTQA